MKLKPKLRAGSRLRGGILRLPAEMLVELAGIAELDYVLIDCEHGPDDLVPLQQHIALAQAHGLPVLVRVGRTAPDQVLRVLDLGADGIVVPHVESAREAEEVVRSAHYPPRGERGFATYSRAGRYGAVTATEHLRAAEDVLVVVMVETGPGVDHTAEIVAVDGIDAVWVGPADLAMSLGVPPGDQAVHRTTAEVHRQARRTGVAVIGLNSVEVAAAVAAGTVEAGLVVLPIDDEGLEVTPLLRDEVCYATADPARAEEPLRIEDLARSRLLLYDAHYGWTDPTRRQLADRTQLAGLRLDPWIEVQHVESALSLAQRGVGDTVLARAVANSSACPSNLHTVGFHEPLYDTIALVRRRSTTLSPATRELANLAQRMLLSHPVA